MPNQSETGRGREPIDGPRRTSPASVWREPARVRGGTVQAGVVVLRTTGCSHWHAGGCSMCGYNAESEEGITPGQISEQFERAAAQLGDVQMLKVYTSGSFLDEREVPQEVAGRVLSHCRERGARLLVESRPEYVTPEKIDALMAIHDDLEVAVGLESANDNVLKYSINKGFTRSDYERAARHLQERGVPLRTYVLLKPPFLTEPEAVADALATMDYAAQFSETLSINPVSVHKGTLVERLWRQWAYRPPWLWSVLEVLRSSASLGREVVCDPTGGGKERGAHNCGECDAAVLRAIGAFTQTQNAEKLVTGDCACRRTWEVLMDVEDLALGGTYDLQRFFRGQNWRSKMH